MSDTDAPAPTGSPTSAHAPTARRPIAARDTRWAARVAAWLVRVGVTPNAISLASVAFSAIAGAALVTTRFSGPAGDAALFLLAIVGIQARLLCNLFDGMVAVEGGRAGKAGEVFNDFPDRLADPILLACAGYAAGGAWGIALGWLAAVLALMTAYVRVLGRSLGTGIYFIGPMAKQHRMATLTTACLVAAGGAFWHVEARILIGALAIICLGCVITVARRTRRIVRDLETRP